MIESVLADSVLKRVRSVFMLLPTIATAEAFTQRHLFVSACILTTLEHSQCHSGGAHGRRAHSDESGGGQLVSRGGGLVS